MENNTTYGRKIVRGEKPSYKTVKRRFVLFTVTLLIVGGLIGALIVALTSKQDDQTTGTTQTASEKNEYIMQQINQCGAYDGRVFTSEASLNWSGDEYEFTPLECDLDEDTQKFTFYLCKAYDIDWTLVMALMQKESSFKSDVVSSTNDYGLMQINKLNHDWLGETLGVTDFLDAEQNIRAGVFILRKLFEEYAEPSLVLMAYNMGSDGAETLWKKGIYTTPYVDDVLKIQAEFNEK